MHANYSLQDIENGHYFKINTVKDSDFILLQIIIF